MDKKMPYINLLDEYGQVPEKSGINWGLNTKELTGGSANTRVADAELRITADLNRTGIIPQKIGSDKIPVVLNWDDGQVMNGSFEQNIKVDGDLYPKALCSDSDKSILGSYLRHRLGVNLTKQITLADLKAYGRTNIEISIQPDGSYYLNFSV